MLVRMIGLLLYGATKTERSRNKSAVRPVGFDQSGQLSGVRFLRVKFGIGRKWKEQEGREEEKLSGKSNANFEKL